MIFLIVMSVFAVVNILHEGGPFDFDILGKLQSTFINFPKHIGIPLVKLMGCPYCLSFWMGLIASLLFFPLSVSTAIGLTCYSLYKIVDRISG
jgi:hypothetical protein